MELREVRNTAGYKARRETLRHPGSCRETAWDPSTRHRLRPVALPCQPEHFRLDDPPPRPHHGHKRASQRRQPNVDDTSSSNDPSDGTDSVITQYLHIRQVHHTLHHRPAIVQTIHRSLPPDHVQLFPDRRQRLAGALLRKLLPSTPPHVLPDVVVGERVTCERRGSASERACVREQRRRGGQLGTCGDPTTPIPRRMRPDPRCHAHTVRRTGSNECPEKGTQLCGRHF
mmetsp:Transcript_12610/g.36059  ORF Transcript_12610/g.36059 Transcript_12610/m.36059 type:complete len:229 (+) Transcript_12610:1674-2360(+)